MPDDTQKSDNLTESAPEPIEVTPEVAPQSSSEVEAIPEVNASPEVLQEQEATPEPISAPTEPREAVPSEAQPSVIATLLIKARDAIFLRKQKKLEKIMELARQRGKIKNKDVREVLRVSSATATRYLNELERTGKIVQSGVVGHEVFYEPVN